MNNHPANVEPVSKQRFRISLFSAFAWLTVIVLIGSHVQTVRQYLRAQERIERLHSMYGMARVIDPQQPEAGGMPVSLNRDVRIHVYQPPGKRYRLCVDTHDVYQFAERFPVVEQAVLTPDVNEFYLFIRLQAAEQGSEAVLTLTWDGGSITEVVSFPQGHEVDHLVRRTGKYFDGSYCYVPPIKHLYKTDRYVWNRNDAPIFVFATGLRDWQRHKGGEGLLVWLEEVPSSDATTGQP
jgi:hypothetical protein